MSEKIFIQSPRIGPYQPPSGAKTAKAESGTDFATVFQEELTKQSQVKFSAHALKRLEDREITFSNRDISQLNEAVNRAEAKGAKETLVLMDQAALIVSIKNRTVITAVDESNLKENVFTNIDSAVIVK